MKRFSLFKCCMSRVQSLNGNMGGQRLGDLHPLELISVEIQPLTLSYTTKTWLGCHAHLVSARHVSTFHLRLKP